MVLAIVLVGIGAGFAGIVLSLMAGFGIVVSLLAYPLAGMLGMACAAGLAALPATVPVIRAQLRAQVREWGA